MAEVNDKFIIEIGEKYNTGGVVSGTEAGSSPVVLYRIKGFNSLVFDDFGLKKLDKYEGDVNEKLLKSATDAAYERGWNDCTSKTLLEDTDAYERGYNAGLLVSKAKSYEQGLKEGFEKGRSEIWDWCGEYIPAKEDGGAIPVEDLQRIFAVEHFREIFKSYSPIEAKQIVEDYLTSKYADLPVVGDEVRYKGNPPSKPFVVTRVSVESTGCFVDGIYDTGGILEDGKFDLMEKTGRHFPVADLLKQMEANDERN